MGQSTRSESCDHLRHQIFSKIKLESLFTVKFRVRAWKFRAVLAKQICYSSFVCFDLGSIYSRKGEPRIWLDLCFVLFLVLQLAAVRRVLLQIWMHCDHQAKHHFSSGYGACAQSPYTHTHTHLNKSLNFVRQSSISIKFFFDFFIDLFVFLFWSEFLYGIDKSMWSSIAAAVQHRRAPAPACAPNRWSSGNWGMWCTFRRLEAHLQRPSPARAMGLRCH